MTGSRLALVTGAASGIGEGIAGALAATGLRVVVADIDDERGTAVAQALPGDATFRHLDVRDAAAVSATVGALGSELGTIGVLVNCAGGSMPKPFLETDQAQWQELIDLNLMSVLRCTHAVLPGMLAQRWGRVINISSNAALQGQGGQAAYSAAKGGVNAVTKTLAREFATDGITVNAVCPGITETPPLVEFSSTAEGREFIARTAAKVPMGRIGRPGDIGAAVAFLAGRAAEFVTGQAWSVSGGAVM